MMKTNKALKIIAFHFIIMCVMILIFHDKLLSDIIAYDPVVMNYPFTPIQGEMSVKQWTGDPNLQLNFEGVEIFPTEDDRSLYKYSCCDQEFRVDAYTGNVTRWNHYGKMKRCIEKKDGGIDPSLQLPAEQIQGLVESFLELKHPGFVLSDHRKSNQTYNDNSVYFYERVTSTGVRLPCGGGVNIDPWSGDINSYVGFPCIPVTISTEPVILESQSELIAVNSFANDESVRSVFILKNDGLVVHDDVLGTQRLVYEITVMTSPEENYNYEVYQKEIAENFGVPSGQWVMVIVDAHTGEVICKNTDWAPLGIVSTQNYNARKRSLFRSFKRTAQKSSVVNIAPIPSLKMRRDAIPVKSLYSPRIMKGRVMVALPTLVALSNASVMVVDRCAVITSGGVSKKLSVGSSLVKIGAKSIKLSAPVQLYHKNIYVPLDAFEKLSKCKATWNAKDKTVEIITPDYKKKAWLRKLLSAKSGPVPAKAGQ